MFKCRQSFTTIPTSWVTVNISLEYSGETKNPPSAPTNSFAPLIPAVSLVWINLLSISILGVPANIIACNCSPKFFHLDPLFSSSSGWTSFILLSCFLVSSSSFSLNSSIIEPLIFSASSARCSSLNPELAFMTVISSSFVIPAMFNTSFLLFFVIIRYLR
ncbi:hypothetical protein ES708_34144 [subsurface metagenome]